MRRGLFCLLLFLTGSTLLAQNKASKTLSVSVAAPPPSTGNLLTGCTVNNSNIGMSCAMPSGWRSLIYEGFETTSLRANEYFTSAGNAYSNVRAHSGRYAENGQFGTGWGTFALPAGHREFYMSFWEWLSPNAVINDEWFIAHVKSQVQNWQEVIFDWGGDNAGKYNITSDNLIIEMQGIGPNYYNPRNLRWGPLTLITNQWVQWEIHYVNNTHTCQGGCSDGMIQVWRNGVQVANFQNANLSGGQDMYDTHGMVIEAGGYYTKIIWVIPPYPATCQAPNQWWLHGGQAPTLAPCSPDRAVTQGSIECGDIGPRANYQCGNTAQYPQNGGFPVPQFDRSLDDIIVLIPGP
jgi:hypothetical protein